MRFGLAVVLALVGAATAYARPYTVKAGDTLYRIAQANGTTTTYLIQLNHLMTDQLRQGQILQLPELPKSVSPAPTRSPVATPSKGTLVVRAAFRQLGRDYVWGASGPYSFDCSGFTRYVYKQFGVDLPHSSTMQFRLGVPVARTALREGDLVFFGVRGQISHVGLYAGDGVIVHASTPRTGVIRSRLSEAYYAARYIGARRILR